MPRFAANLSFLYNEVPFLDRFAAAAHDGFAAVEFAFGYDFVAKEIAARLDAHGLMQVLINAPPADPSHGDRGLASLPHIGHIQIAGVPERHEPDLGEVNYRHIFALLDELSYRGWIGCEYRPLAGTSAGLSWMKTLL